MNETWIFVHPLMTFLSECGDEGEAMMVLSDYLGSITSPAARYAKRRSSVSGDKQADSPDVCFLAFLWMNYYDFCYYIFSFMKG